MNPQLLVVIVLGLVAGILVWRFSRDSYVPAIGNYCGKYWPDMVDYAYKYKANPSYLVDPSSKAIPLDKGYPNLYPGLEDDGDDPDGMNYITEPLL